MRRRVVVPKITDQQPPIAYIGKRCSVLSRGYRDTGTTISKLIPEGDRSTVIQTKASDTQRHDRRSE
jgi:hypothetical protein